MSDLGHRMSTSNSVGSLGREFDLRRTRRVLQRALPRLLLFDHSAARSAVGAASGFDLMRHSGLRLRVLDHWEANDDPDLDTDPDRRAQYCAAGSVAQRVSVPVNLPMSTLVFVLKVPLTVNVHFSFLCTPVPPTHFPLPV